MSTQIQNYAKSILDTIDIKKDELIWVGAPVTAKELILEIQKQIIGRGAYADLDLHFEEAGFNRLYNSTQEQLEKFPVSEKARVDNCDKYIAIWSLDDYVIDYSKIPPENLETSRRVRNLNSRRLDTIPGVGAMPMN